MSTGADQTTAGEAPTIEWIGEFIARWLDAWNSHEVDRVLECLTDDVEIRDDSWPQPMHGHADVREFLEALWRAVPDMTFELLDGPYLIPGQPRASFRWRGSGTFTGPMSPPGFAPTGRRWEVDGADFQEYRDGRICNLRVAFDMMTVARQLGVMPAIGSRSERTMAVMQRASVRVQQEYRRRRSAHG
jgi:steroid delta-isomerase-like uncharacterized protein